MTYAPHRATLQTPLGAIIIAGDGAGVSEIHIGAPSAPQTSLAPPDESPVAMAVQQLRAYFAGTQRIFSVPLPPLASERGMALRSGMMAIPFGSTMTYGALAKALGSAPRAVGQACRRNPLPIIVPCHRVISSAGAEFYSAGNGPVTKAWLIAHERQLETE